MKITIKHVTTLLALMLVAPALAVADSHRERGERDDPGRHMERMAERLELTEEQKEDWRTLHEAHLPRMREIRGEMLEQRRALRQAASDGLDETAAENAARRLGELTTEAELERARMHARLQEVLTEEQREKLAGHHAHMHEKRGEKKHRMERGTRRGKEPQ